MSTLPIRCSASTTFAVEEVKIRRPARAKVQGGRTPLGGPSADGPGRGWRNLTRLDWRRWTGIRLRYSHGADPHVIVRARGREWSYPWDIALLDVLADVCNR